MVKNASCYICLVSSEVEQRLDKALAAGSIPALGTKYCWGLVKWYNNGL